MSPHLMTGIRFPLPSSTLFTLKVQGDVSAAAICSSGRTNVSQTVLEKIKVQSISVVKCAGGSFRG